VSIDNAPDNIIGGTTAGARNVISGNGPGVVIGTTIGGSGATGNIVQGNYIGTDVTGTTGLGNGSNGVKIYNASNNIVGGTDAGEANVIAFNGFAGVIVLHDNIVGVSSTGNRILSNAIFSNGALGIDLLPPTFAAGVMLNDAGDGDSGANNLQNYPFLSAVTPNGGDLEITGNLSSTANTAFRLEFFANALCDSSGYGEGQTSSFHRLTTDGAARPLQ
jgi:hypothetical protein